MANLAKRLMSVPIPVIVDNPTKALTLMIMTKGMPLPITFPIMPESLMALKKYLVTITNTIGGGWVDDYGKAPSPFTISGTFGYNTKATVGGKVYSGFGWTKYLEWIVDQSHEPEEDGSLPETWMLSWISQHYFKVVLEDFNITQNISRNNLWVYTLRITAIEPIVNYDATAITDIIAQKLSVEILTKVSGTAIDAITQIEL